FGIVAGARFIVAGTGFSLPGTRFIMAGTGFSLPGTRFIMAGTGFVVGSGVLLRGVAGFRPRGGGRGLVGIGGHAGTAGGGTEHRVPVHSTAGDPQFLSPLFLT